MGGRKRGRKSTYDAKWHPVIARALARSGCTSDQIAAEMGIGRNTLYKWMRKYKAFAEAVAQGREYVDARVEDSLLRRALGMTLKDREVVVRLDAQGRQLGQKVKHQVHHVPPDTVAAIFWLKNRRPDVWRDVQRREHTGLGGAPIKAEIGGGLSEQEVERIAEAVIHRNGDGSVEIPDANAGGEPAVHPVDADGGADALPAQPEP